MIVKDPSGEEGAIVKCQWMRTALLAVGVDAFLAACGSSSSSTTTRASAATTSTGSVPAISAGSINNSFSAMATLQPLIAQGKGKMAAILPDTTSATRYVEFDAPMLKQAATAAGLPASDMIGQNAQGSDPTFISDAQGDITNGAAVLIDPEDAGSGVTVQRYAKSHGVAMRCSP
jgi:D-xylose transport system substrate-binding protein